MFVEKLGLPRTALDGKVVLVTGAGRGIGKELARALAWLGAKIVIAEIMDTGENVKELIEKENGSALFVKTDLSNENDIKHLVDVVMKQFGRVDILVNNAAVFEPGSFLELPIEKWDHAYSVNIRSAVSLIKAFLPQMLKNQNGVIVTVTSADGTPYMAPYFATKAALSSLGSSLAAELDETSVSVFVFGPGMIDTPAIQSVAKELAPRFGMTESEFLMQGGNPGYEGLMPADHCAAGWAWCIVHADEYHGQIADPFTPLNRLGLLKTNKVKQSSSNIDEISGKILEIIKLIENVNAILQDVKRETDEQGFFARKWVFRMLAKRTGMKIEKWMEFITELNLEFQQLATALLQEETEFVSKVERKLGWIVDSLIRLETYFKQTAEDARGWFKDPDALSQALEVIYSRESAVSMLHSKIQDINVLI